MKKHVAVFIIFIIASTSFAKAQKVDSIFFNLYTDSLKKGTYNYINVDGKLSDGRWMPLTTKDIFFSTTAGKFDQNSLILEKDFKEEKVTITATLKGNTAISKTVTIYIKKNPDNEVLKTADEVLREMEQQSKPGKRNRNHKKSR